MLKNQFQLKLLHIFVKNQILNKFHFLLIFLTVNLLITQNQKKELFVKYTDKEITVDGILDESDWSLALPEIGRAHV